MNDENLIELIYKNKIAYLIPITIGTIVFSIAIEAKDPLITILMTSIFLQTIYTTKKAFTNVLEKKFSKNQFKKGFISLLVGFTLIFISPIINSYKVVNTENSNIKKSENLMFDLGKSVAYNIDNENSSKIVKEPTDKMNYSGYITLIIATAFIDYSIPFLLTHKLENYYKENTLENKNEI